MHRRSTPARSSRPVARPVSAGSAFLVALALAGTPAARAADGASTWLRTPAISPDGGSICFSYRGDLWIVGAAGGDARPLTSHVAHDHSPVWSPDGSRIAFASDRHGQFDVFVVSARGGPAERLTFHSAHDVPSSFAPDGSAVLFTSARLDAPEACVASPWLPELYSVPVAGGRARQVLTTAAERAVWSADGTKILYHDRKGYENEWRKHHRSSVTRDVWVYDATAARHEKLTSFEGEDRNPVWAPGGASFWYLSETDGTSNVWRRDLTKDAVPTQVTRHAGHPVRFLSAASDGTLCYAWRGDLWTLAAGGEPRRLDVRCPADDRTNPVENVVARDGATEMAPSPSGLEVAFVVRGDVFVASAEHGTTRRITATPGMERSVSWEPDGRALHFAAERDGSWNLHRAVLDAKETDGFARAAAVREEVVLATPKEEFQPLVSPDGRWVAYVEDRDAIAVLDLASKATRVLVPAAYNYSYSDGDLRFSWSPDSRWLAFGCVGGRRWIGDVGVVSLATGGIENMTRSGYEEDFPQWSADGGALLFLSDRAGRKNHASWGADQDVFAMSLTLAAWERARLSREDFDLLRAKEETSKKDAAPAPEGAAKPADAAKAAPVPVEIEFEGRDRRIRRMTTISAPVAGWAAAPDGETVVLFAQVDDAWALWAARPRDGEQKRILETSGPGDVVFAQDGKSVFVRTEDGRIARVELSGLDDGGKPGRRGDGEGGGIRGERKDVAYAAELSIDLPAERAAMFEHAWRQARAKFYDPDLHGTDWEALRTEYARFLPHVANRHEFAELLSELLGELNASHTGARHRFQPDEADRTSSLGLLYDVRWQGAGLRVAEVLTGGPADRKGTKLGPGAVIVAIDGVPLPATYDPARALNRKAGKWVAVTFTTAAGETAEERIRAIDAGAEAALVHERWMRRTEQRALELSGGRVGYAHVDGMDDGSYRELFRDALGKHGDREALLVDTRWNGGGWLHDDLVGFLGARDYLWFVPRGKSKGELGAEPARRWTRPVAVLMNEGNYSDAHVFPYAFRALGLGKLVGTSVAGTGTAVWWERQVDPSIVFGIPQVGLLTPDGAYLENLELRPDVEVLAHPDDVARGDDRQLAAAVRVLLEEADRKR